MRNLTVECTWVRSESTLARHRSTITLHQFAAWYSRRKGHVLHEVTIVCRDELDEGFRFSGGNRLQHQHVVAGSTEEARTSTL